MIKIPAIRFHDRKPVHAPWPWVLGPYPERAVVCETHVDADLAGADLALEFGQRNIEGRLRFLDAGDQGWLLALMPADYTPEGGKKAPWRPEPGPPSPASPPRPCRACRSAGGRAAGRHTAPSASGPSATAATGSRPPGRGWSMPPAAVPSGSRLEGSAPAAAAGGGAASTWETATSTGVTTAEGRAPSHSAEGRSMPLMTDDSMLTVRDVAARLGLAVSTVQTYRRDGRLPEPDGLVGRVPWWRPATIDRWQAARPGRGRAGIPRKPR
mgnify:CR=1 FL=1